MKMYKTEESSAQIVEIDVERTTEKSVWYHDHYGLSRFARHSDNKNYWDTWEDARDHLINRAQNKKVYLLEQVEKLNERIETLIAMKKGH